MVEITVREGDSSAFTYSFNGYNPQITVEFVDGTATSQDGYGGTRTSSSVTSINGYVYAQYTYSLGAYVDSTDEENEQFTLEVYYNGILDETVTVTILDDFAWHGTQASETWFGSADDDAYFAYSGADVVRGRNGDDEIEGGNGHDRLIGGNGFDVLFGGEGRDILLGGSDADTLAGDAGNDQLFGGGGSDSLSGGKGHDFLSGGNGHDTLTGGDGGDEIEGGKGRDTINGGNGHDTLTGGNGHDTLTGGNGGDEIEGGNGRDTINGGNGNDILTGGASVDSFIFSGKFGHDRITDFEISGRERIDLAEAADIQNFKELTERYATNTDEGVLIEISRKASILIESVEISELSGQDFIF